jgi:hypothetical protein
MNKYRCSKHLAQFFPFLLLFLSPAHATSFTMQPFPKTVQDAPLMVRGKVGMSYSDWSKEDTKRLYTYTELQITEVLKGNVIGPSLIMRELGGEKDGTGLRVPGASKYEKGEDVVVTLTDKNEEGSYSVIGMMMGKFNVQTDGEGKEYISGPGLAGDIPANSKWTLDGVRQLIKEQALNSDETVDSANQGKVANAKDPKNGRLPNGKPSPINSAAPTHSSPTDLPGTTDDTSSGKSASDYIPLGIGLIFIALLGLFLVLRRKR